MIRAIAALTLVLFPAAFAFASERSATNEPELRVEVERHSLTRDVRLSTQYIDGLRVVGGERVEVARSGQPFRTAHERLAARPGLPNWPLMSITTFSAASRELVWVNLDGVARLAWRIEEETRHLEPWARYYDAVSGVLLREERLFWSVRARVFEVNPVAKLNDASLRDQNDSAAAVPAEAYSIVDLPAITVPVPLEGPDVRIVDSEAPFTQHADASTPLDTLDRHRPEFEEANAFFQIGRSKEYLRSLGYVGIRELVAYTVPADAHAANGTDNSYFIESPARGQGTLYFGDGGTDDAEDSDIVLHEFAHAIHSWIAPGALTGTPASQARAISEGFADYWAFSSTYQATAASGRDPFCIADWDARCAGDDPSQNCGYPEGSDCLRRVDSTKTMAGYASSDAAGTEYANSAIWSSALRTIFMSLTGRLGIANGKRVVDTVVLESMFGMAPQPGFRDLALRMVDADIDLRGGADVDAICMAMTERGILSAAECGTAPRSEWTLLPAVAAPIPIPDGGNEVLSPLVVTDARTIAALAVRVDIRHPSRGDLTVALIAPDGTRITLVKSSSTDRTPDIHATFGIDATPAASLAPLLGRSAAGVWQLAVRDVLAGESGVLESWGLVVHFTGDEPAASRPASSTRGFAPAAHVSGATGRLWTTELTLANRGSASATAEVVFTPQGWDGRSTFASMKVALAPGETVALNDIVGRLGYRGNGAIEVEGPQDVIAVTRTFFAAVLGTFGDSAIPSTGEQSSIVPFVSNDARSRSNLGILETSGRGGNVRVRFYDGSNGALLDERNLAILPFSSLQIPVSAAAGRMVSELVADSGMRIAAFASVLDRATDDSIIIAAESPSSEARTVFGPMIRTVSWSSEAWLAGKAAGFAAGVTLRDTPSGRLDITPFTLIAPLSVPIFAPPPPFTTGAMRVDLQPGSVVAAVLRGSGGAGWSPFFSGLGGGDVVGFEVSDLYRANAGMLNPNGVPLRATAEIRDAGGVLLGRETAEMAAGSTFQFALPPGAVRVTFSPGVFGYASRIDLATGDSSVFPAR